MTLEPDVPNPYRKIAIDRLSSPEQLDHLMEVTRPLSWLALAGLGILLTAAILWSIFDTIPTKIAAEGMLIRPGGLYEVYAPAEGVITEIHVAEGGVVAKAQPLATIDQPELTAQIAELSATLEQQRAQLRELTQRAGAFRRLSPAALALARANEEVAIQNAEQTLIRLNERLKTSSIIASPYAGRILEIKVRPGDMVGRSAKLLSLQLAGESREGLQAVIYVPSANGKNITPGMSVQVAPATAAPEEYGYLLATVTYVSEFPATREGMMRVLGNESLVASLSLQGPPFAVYADLRVVSGSSGSYLWSSTKGEQPEVNSGTPCEAFITIRQQRPIEFVLPVVRQFWGL
jgi:multidrug efflux pump subunit AcrA (membrane-fusion protein)